MRAIKLPHGFFHDEKLYNMAEIRGITGREQNYLINIDLIKHNKHISKILASCVLSLSTEDGEKLETPIPNIIEEMLTTDRFFLMVQIRIDSLGSKYHFEHVCLECHKKTAYTQDLEKLEVKYAKDSVKAYDITLPSGKSAKIRLPIGKDEQKLFNIIEKHRDSLATSLIALSLVELDGKKPVKEDLLDMSIVDSQFITSVLEEHGSGIDEWLEFTCSECGEEYCEPLPAGSSNFFSRPPKEKDSIEI